MLLKIIHQDQLHKHVATMNLNEDQTSESHDYIGRIRHILSGGNMATKSQITNNFYNTMTQNTLFLDK
jgi:hypothetical protein